MCIDSYVKHKFTFTPAISLYVTCFAWVADKFGISWHLTLKQG